MAGYKLLNLTDNATPTRLRRIVSALGLAMILEPTDEPGITTPQLLWGTGIPAVAAPNGSVAIRLDPASTSEVFYHRIAAAWVAGGAGAITGDQVAAALGIRTHVAGTVEFFVHTDTGDDDANDGLTVGTPWKTAVRCFEAYRYSRVILGEEATLTFQLKGTTLPFVVTSSDWHEMANVNFVGSDEVAVLASTATLSSTYTVGADDFLKVVLSGAPLVAGTLEDGTWIVDVAGTADPRAVIEATSTSELLYTGNNSDTISTVVTSPAPIRLYRQATTVELTGFGGNARPLWDNVRFTKLDIGPDAASVRPSNGTVNFTECLVRVNYSQEADLAVFDRCRFKPNAFNNLGRSSFHGGVIDGRGATALNFTRARKDSQLKNAVCLYKPVLISHEGNCSVTKGGQNVHVHCIDMVQIAPSVKRFGPGGVIPFDNILLTGRMATGASATVIDGGNTLLGGWHASNDIKRSVADGGADALVTGMLRDTVIQASAPGVTDDDANGFSVGNRIIDTAADTVYECVDSSTGAAVWKDLTAAPPYVVPCCAMGGKSDGVGRFLNANGASTMGDDTSKARTRSPVIVPVGTTAKIVGIAYQTNVGTSVIGMKVHRNGLVVQTFTLASINVNDGGQEDWAGWSVSTGDYLELEYDSDGGVGDEPGESIWWFLMEVTP